MVLLVEDEYLIRDLLQSTLEDADYGVESAASGNEAMALLNQGLRGLAGLVTDIKLGAGPTGWEVARQARALHRALPVVYMSGDSFHEFTTHGVTHSLFVQKPFVATEILSALATSKTQIESAPISA